MTSAQKNRFWFIVLCFVFASGFVTIIMSALYHDISYYVTPSDVLNKKHLTKHQNLRLGGCVQQGTLEIIDSHYHFKVYDEYGTINVMSTGPLPPLFKDNQGIVMEGTFSQEKNIFIAKQILAKHDETYKPKSCAKS